MRIFSHLAEQAWSIKDFDTAKQNFDAIKIKNDLFTSRAGKEIEQCLSHNNPSPSEHRIRFKLPTGAASCIINVPPVYRQRKKIITYNFKVMFVFRLLDEKRSLCTYCNGLILKKIYQ